jgi:hypothetical protein
MFVAAMLVALAAAQTSPTTPAPTMPYISSLGNPNYLRDNSVHVQSPNNPVFSFPSQIEEPEAPNGKLYRGVPIIGGVNTGPMTDRARAAATYGAADQAELRVQSEVQGLFRFHPSSTVEFSPWTPVATQKNSHASDAYSRAQEKMSRRAEEARQDWLKDNGYIGGVRTFVNDAELYPAAPEAKKTQLPEPRGVIELAPDAPRFKSRMHVNGDLHLPATMRTAELIKVVRPAEAPKAQAKADDNADDKAQDKPDTKVAAK